MKQTFAKTAKATSKLIIEAYVNSDADETDSFEKLLTTFHNVAPSQVDSGIGEKLRGAKRRAGNAL